MPDDLFLHLQALLIRWDEQRASAVRKLERFENPIAGGFYTGAMFGYEDCADDLALLLKEVLAARIELPSL